LNCEESEGKVSKEERKGGKKRKRTLIPISPRLMSLSAVRIREGRQSVKREKRAKEEQTTTTHGKS
jgi:hypothetical protein